MRSAGTTGRRGPAPASSLRVPTPGAGLVRGLAQGLQWLNLDTVSMCCLSFRDLHGVVQKAANREAGRPGFRCCPGQRQLSEWPPTGLPCRGSATPGPGRVLQGRSPEAPCQYGHFVSRGAPLSISAPGLLGRRTEVNLGGHAANLPQLWLSFRRGVESASGHRGCSQGWESWLRLLVAPLPSADCVTLGGLG